MNSSLALMAIAAVGAQQPDLDREISLVRQAASLKQVAAGISVSTGIPIVVKDVDTVPVLASVSQKPLRQVLDRLAEVTDAQWTSSNGTITIFRSIPKAVQAREAYRTAYGKALADSIAEYSKENVGSTDWSNEAVKKRIQEDLKRRSQMGGQATGNQNTSMISFSNEGEKGSPAMAAMVETIKNLPVAKVLDIKEGEFAIYSSSPNRSQQPLPMDGARIANAFLAANNAIASQAIDSQNTNQVTVETGFPIDAKKINRVNEVIVRVVREETQVFVRLFIIGENGAILGQKTELLAMAPATPAPTPLKMERVTPKPEYTDLVKRFSANRGMMFLSSIPLMGNVTVTRAVAAEASERIAVGSKMDVPSGLAPKPLRDTLSSPASKEPWDVLLGDLLSEAAKASETNLIASFDDGYFLSVAPSFAGKTIPAETLSKAISDGRNEIKVAEGWLLVKPQFPSHAEDARVPRIALDQASKALIKTGYPTFEIGANYIRRGPALDAGASLDRAWLTATHASTNGWRPTGRWDWLKIFASLGTSQRAQGGAFAASTFSGPERNRIWQKALDSGGGGFMGGTVIMRMEVGGASRFAQPPIAQLEPSENYPDGMPGNLGLYLDRRRSSAAYGTAGGDQGGDFLTPGQLAGELPKGIDGWQIAFQDVVSLRVGVQPRGGGGGILMDYGITGGVVSFEGLPQAFHAEIEQAKLQRKRMQQAELDARSRAKTRGGGGGS